VCGETIPASGYVERAVSDGRRFDHLPIHHGFALASIESTDTLDDAEALAAALTVLGRLEMPCILVSHDRLRDAVAAAGLDRMLRCLVLLTGDVDPVELAFRADLVIADTPSFAEACATAGTPIVTVRLDATGPSPYPGSVDAVPTPIGRP
jgi:hypothetical protein